MSQQYQPYGWSEDNHSAAYPGVGSANSGQQGTRLPPLEGLLAGPLGGREVAEARQPSQPYTSSHLPPQGSYAPPYQQPSYIQYPPNAVDYHPTQPPPAIHYQDYHNQYPPPASGPRDPAAGLPRQVPSPLPHGPSWNQLPPLPPPLYSQPPSSAYPHLHSPPYSQPHPYSHPYSHSYVPRHDPAQAHLAHEARSQPWDPSQAPLMSQHVTTQHVSAIIASLSEIPNLLTPDREHVVKRLKFSISMRQQPKAARACGSGERDRRNIDPPPIVQLQIEGPGVTKEEIAKYLRYESYVVTCCITDETGTQDMSRMPAEYRHQRRLTGSLVGTPFVGRDENGEEGCFFPFSDLSVRTLGRYRLKFSMIMVDPANAGMCTHFPILSEILSAPFDVYTAKEFPGINESTRLVRTLREQGCIIAIKKGNDKKRQTRETDESNNDDEGSDDRRANIQR